MNLITLLIVTSLALGLLFHAMRGTGRCDRRLEDLKSCDDRLAKRLRELERGHR